MKIILLITTLALYANVYSQIGLEVENHDVSINGKLILSDNGTSIIIGKDAGNSNIANGNVIIGHEAGFNLSSSSAFSNTFIGRASGGGFNRGLGNVTIGSGSGGLNSAGDYNTFIGTSAGSNTGGVYPNNTGSNNVFIGYDAGQSVDANENYRLVIESDENDQDTPLIYGEFDNDHLIFDATVHITQTLKLNPLQSPPTCDSSQIGLMYLDASEDLFLCKTTGWKKIETEP